MKNPLNGKWFLILHTFSRQDRITTDMYWWHAKKKPKKHTVREALEPHIGVFKVSMEHVYVIPADKIEVLCPEAKIEKID